MINIVIIMWQYLKNVNHCYLYNLLLKNTSETHHPVLIPLIMLKK